MRILRKYQKSALRFVSKLNTFALFMDMRLGKTLVVVRLLRRHKGPFLIVAPNEALISWELELEKEGEQYIRLAGSRSERILLMTGCRPSVRYWLLNKEGFLVIPEISSQYVEAVILDESTFIKNPKAKVTKFYTTKFRSAPIRAILTGTPAPEGPLDYISQLRFLDDRLLGLNYWVFRTRLCKRYGFDWFVTRAGRKLIADAVNKVAFRLTRKDAGVDIGKVYERRVISFPSRLKKVAETIRKEFILEWKGKELDRTTLAVIAFNWLRQLSAGVVKGKRVWDGKLKVIYNLLKTELSGQSVVVWTNYVRCENDALYKYLRKRKVKVCYISGKVEVQKRKAIIRSFGSGKYKVLICQSSCGTYGLDLSVADTAIYLSCPLSFLARKQGEDRILATSKTKSLLYIDIVVKGSVDEHVLKGIREKLSKQKIIEKYMAKRTIL